MIEGHIASYSPRFYSVNEMGHIYYERDGKRVCIDTKRNITFAEKIAQDKFLMSAFAALSRSMNASTEPEKPQAV